MSKRNWWIVGSAAVVVVVVVAVLGVVKLVRHAPSDCDTVHAMVAYNTQFDTAVQESANAGDPNGSSVAEYQKWAARLHEYAGQIKDSQLAQPANAVAGLADQMVDVVPRVRAESAANSANPPPSVAEYGRIGRDFHDNFAKLKNACPA
ncbi:hypothetical protein ACQ86B_22215 [Mycolicibacterium aichiense]|uniref:hypothetical protein n=1 Tax=Mycolicibacterium aichiense TaxID=1799 RepID=UPI003D675592